MGQKRVEGAKRVKNYLQESALAKETPKGVKALLLYSIVTAFFYKFFLLLGFYSPSQINLERESLFLNSLVLALLLIFLYAVLTKKAWAYHLSIVWFSASILLSLASFAMISTAYPTIRALLILSGLAMIFVDTLAIWYIVEKQHHFNPAKPVLKYDHIDKTFLYILSSFWLILILLAAGLGFSFYQQSTTLSDKMLEELKGTSIIHGLVICDDKKNMEHDICYVTLAAIYPNQDLRALCGKVQSDFFRWTCLQNEA